MSRLSNVNKHRSARHMYKQTHVGIDQTEQCSTLASKILVTGHYFLI